MTRILAALGALLLCTGAGAHERSTSSSSWELRGREALVGVRLTALDASRLPWGASDEALGTYLVRRLGLLAGGEPCAVLDGPRALAAPAGRIAYEFRVSCPPAGPLALRSEILLDVAPSHLHFARVARDGGPAEERVLSDAERVWPLDASRAGGTSLAGYVALGLGHILTGYDHLAFLLALMLLGGSVRQVAGTVTGFTVAHSVTLGLATLGWVRPEAAPVEALIGLSIALVAAENVWLARRGSPALPGLVGATLFGLSVVAALGHGRLPALTLAGLGLFVLCHFALLGRVARPAALRWTVAFVFGLVHGFGFAAALVDAGLAPGRVAPALLGFNAGVELGQLAVVALVWPILRATTRRWRLAVIEIGSAAVAGLGVFWFVVRAYGPG
jgi:hypothetical protein